MPEGTQPQASGEEIGDILRAQFEKSTEAPTTTTTKAEPAVAATPATIISEAAPPTGDQPRAADGKFAPKDKAAPAAPAEAKPPVDPNAAVAAPPVVDPAAAPPAPAKEFKAPIGWKHGAEKWGALPAEAKEFFTQREGDFNRGIQTYSQMAGFGNTVFQEFKPYEGLMNHLGANPQSAIRFLLGAYAQLKTGTPAQKAQFIAAMAQEEGVDLASIVTNGVPAVDPEMQALRQQVAQLTNYLTSSHQQQKQVEQSGIHSQIEAFAADPAHEHFESVKPFMVALLQGGQATDLQDAYDKACYASPEIRASKLSQLQAQEAEKRRKEAEAAQRAGVSLTGAPTVSSRDVGDMDLRQNLEHQFGVAGRV